MMILGIDPAATLGWGLGERAGPFRSGAFQLPAFSDIDRPRAFAMVYCAIKSLVQENKVEGVVVEAPLQKVSRKNKRGVTTPTSAHGVSVLTMLSGAVQAGAYSGGARHFWYPEPSQWRKAVLGAAFPENPKASAIRYCELVLRATTADHNAAEGLCLMQFGHGQAKLL
jgi:hypothetical protein